MARAVRAHASLNARTVQALCAALVLGLGALVLIGWAWDQGTLKTALPGLTSMKANTALGFMLAGSALALLGRPPGPMRDAGAVCAGGLLALALATAFEQVTGIAPGVDLWLFDDPATAPDRHPGRMALATSIGFVLAAVSLLISRNAAHSLPRSRLAHALAIAVAVLGGLGLAGYAVDVEIFYGIPGFGTVALHTALGLLLLATGLLAAGRGGIWAAPPRGEDVQAEARARNDNQALLASSELLRSIFEDGPDAILVVNNAGQIVEASPRVESLFGYSRPALLGQQIEILLPERYRAEHPAHRAAFAAEPHARAMGSGLALAGRRADGSEFAVDVVLSPIRSSGAARTIAIVRDISARLATEQGLAEKTVLLQEIHHRVKNNLQVIVSLLRLQADTLQDAAARSALADSQARVQSMALLHQLLYEHKDFARVSLDDYLRQLVQHTLNSANAPQVTVNLDLVPLQLDLQRAVPCGLLVNELLSNACKHAFPDGRNGTLTVELHAPGADGLALLAVSDDGIGLPPEVEIGQTRSLGLQLVPLLTEQIGAELRVVRGAGTRFELRFRAGG
ncbi:MAG: histidine kinase dimerization/phosphoacceptor domain -containing protein [Thiobacillus sp.]|nr:histidine kinase dimerization/phosphoacceptor domain -containing protein [Thiobacillus sp.]